MLNVNTAPDSPEFEHVLGVFESTDRPWSFICKKPSDRGAWIFVNKMERRDGEVWPKRGHHYIVAITGMIRSGNARHGQLVTSVEAIQRELVISLRQATWELDRHGRLQLVGEYLSTPWGTFRPFYDNGYRSNGADESPSIYFSIAMSRYEELISPYQGYLVCLDETEIERAKAAKRPQGVEAAPDLGDLLREKFKAKGD